jgi:hypothetical protein
MSYNKAYLVIYNYNWREASRRITFTLQGPSPLISGGAAL